MTTLELSNNKTISPSHQLILENYVDENHNTVNIDDYILDGVVLKSGSIFAQVRATGTGLFPNNSDHAVTVDSIELRFEKAVQYTLSFDLNGAAGTIPTAQLLSEGATGTVIDNPIRTGYIFKAWNTAQNGSGTDWVVGVTPMLAQDTTLYA